MTDLPVEAQHFGSGRFRGHAFTAADGELWITLSDTQSKTQLGAHYMDVEGLDQFKELLTVMDLIAAQLGVGA
jgi:hypothetical protein